MTSNTVLPLWENPEIQGLNRLPMRSPLLPVCSPQAALADAVAGPEYRNPGDNPFYFLNDCAQRGLGTVACGPDTLEPYRVRSGFFTLRLFLG
jgi:hypothetical protein